MKIRAFRDLPIISKVAATTEIPAISIYFHPFPYGGRRIPVTHITTMSQAKDVEVLLH
jgi:hypothetical protein